MKITKEQLYQSQTTLSEIGKKGQQKLNDAEIIVIGCGGLGSVAAVYLAASGIGNIHLVDFDVVKVSDLYRQVFYKTEDIGKSKVEVLAKHLQSISPFVHVTYNNQKVNKSNAIDLIDEFSIVVDCTDSLSTKYLLNDVCVITDTILVYGSLHKYDGYVATFNMTKGAKRTANLRDAFPDMASQRITNSSKTNSLNTISGIIGLMQANEVIKIITRYGKPLMNELLIYNSLENSQIRIKLSSEPCYKKADRGCILKTFKHQKYDDNDDNIGEDDMVISDDDFKNRIDEFEIISVFEDKNIILPFEVSIKIPFSKFDIGSIKLEPNKKYVVVCNKGIASYVAALIIKEEYPDNIIFCLEHGITNLKF